MPPLKTVVSVLDMPLLMSMLRGEMAEIIRINSQDEEPRVRKRLLEYAAAFECGQVNASNPWPYDKDGYCIFCRVGQYKPHKASCKSLEGGFDGAR